MTLLSAALAALVSPWFLLLTGFVGVSQWLFVLVGACPASLVLRRLFSLQSVCTPDRRHTHEHHRRPRRRRARQAERAASQVGPIGRLGRYTATHFRTVLIGWALVAVVLGFFAPKVETALSGAGWEASGSQSVQARKLVERDFAGLGSYGLMTVVYSPTETVGSPAFRSAIARVEQTLRADAP